jgi:hypothetical protein
MILGHSIDPRAEILHIMPAQIAHDFLKHLHYRVFGAFLILQILHAHPEKQVGITLKEDADIGPVIGIAVAFHQLAVTQFVALIAVQPEHGAVLQKNAGKVITRLIRCL